MDVDALATYCQATAYKHQAQSQLNKECLTVQGRQARTVRDPAALQFEAMAEYALRSRPAADAEDSARTRIAP